MIDRLLLTIDEESKALQEWKKLPKNIRPSWRDYWLNTQITKALKPRLNRPELRGDIYKLLCQMIVSGESSTVSISKYWERERYWITDKILALQPTEGEISSKERESIYAKLSEIAIGSGDINLQGYVVGLLQALRGEK